MSNEKIERDAAEARRDYRSGEGVSVDGSTVVSRATRRAKWNSPSERTEGGVYSSRWHGVK